MNGISNANSSSQMSFNVVVIYRIFESGSFDLINVRISERFTEISVSITIKSGLWIFVIWSSISVFTYSVFCELRIHAFSRSLRNVVFHDPTEPWITIKSGFSSSSRWIKVSTSFVRGKSIVCTYLHVLYQKITK